MNTIIEFDPLEKFPGVTHTVILSIVGLLPIWLSGRNKNESGKDAIIRQYQFYMGEIKNVELHSNGVYSFPNDPDQYPILKFTLPANEVVYLYQYGIVGAIQNEETWMARFD